MITARQQQIVGAMQGRQASAVNDGALRDAVRSKLVELATKAGRPLEVGRVGSITLAVLQAAAKTICFEAEIPIALEMGAAGELEHEGTTVNQANAPKWVTAYACCGDRRAAQNFISIQSARDRARTDAVAATELRETFEREGLRRAWEAFVAEGRWDFLTGYAAVLYDRIGVAAVRALLDSDQIATAKADAFAAVRRDHAQHYRTTSDADIEIAPIFKMHYKAQLCRAYFETLRARGLDITFKPNNS